MIETVKLEDILSAINLNNERLQDIINDVATTSHDDTLMIIGSIWIIFGFLVSAMIILIIDRWRK